MSSEIKSARIRYVVEELRDQYLAPDRRPWVVGFSGGKDSTVLLELVWKALELLRPAQRQRPVYVVSNDTLVENPLIQQYLDRVLAQIRKAAVRQTMPIHVERTRPENLESYWVNVIGRGYPVPNSSFRWCTERLKIRPSMRFVARRVASDGQVIMLLGTRRHESGMRRRSIRRHEIVGERLSHHPNAPGAYVYSPIKELLLEEVWYVINALPSPWGADNGELFKLYADASADDYECPTMLADTERPTCGQSRFGCWTCTLVQQDRALQAQVDNGAEWLRPLLVLRNALVAERNIPGNRQPYRRNGQWAEREDGRRFGPYTAEYRQSLLVRLLNAQRAVQQHVPTLELIGSGELQRIQQIWHQDGIMARSVAEIYAEVYQKRLDMARKEEKDAAVHQLIEQACRGSQADVEAIEKLVQLQRQYQSKRNRRGLNAGIEQILQQYARALRTEGDESN